MRSIKGYGGQPRRATEDLVTRCRVDLYSLPDVGHASRRERDVMSEKRFDGRVAIVTGAGSAEGIGRANAMLLAERGAKVVVNDFGVGPDGRGIERSHAEIVAQEIRDLGGEAVADTNSVAGQESARAVVQTAIDAYGRLDILVNNAGIARPAEFGEASTDDIESQIAVHLMGTIWMCKAAWPVMVDQRYGRIVSTSSGAAFGARWFSIYGAAKGGILALMRNLALEGAEHGIKANSTGPFAITTAFKFFNDDVAAGRTDLPPRAVAAVVAYLCHEDCELTAEYVECGGGRAAVGVFGATAGLAAGSEITIEDVADGLDLVTDRKSFVEFPNPTVDDNTGALALKDPSETGAVAS